jgi:predicted aldo/keto reductase-like oxidoreductase
MSSGKLFHFDLPNSVPGRKSTIPSVGFGCWKLPKESASDLVFEAIEAGYRHIDSAADYGNEKEVILGSMLYFFKKSSQKMASLAASSCERLIIILISRKSQFFRRM